MHSPGGIEGSLRFQFSECALRDSNLAPAKCSHTGYRCQNLIGFVQIALGKDWPILVSLIRSEKEWSKPSIIRLDLISMSDNPDMNMKN
jgi:hypothetical protein